MAITGTGTQEDPYLVHSYSELKTVTTDNSYCPQYSHRYIALDADINCNDYGADFEWETITLGHNNRGFTFDLNGHTIKNIAVKLNNSIFDASYAGSNVYGEWYAEFIGNGKILNIFTKSNSNASLIIGKDASRVVENLSMSVHLGDNPRAVFKYIKLSRVSLYLECNNTGNIDKDALILAFPSDTSDESSRMTNCDFLLNVTNMKTSLYYSNYYGSSRVAASDCRFRGKISNEEGLSGYRTYMVAEGNVQNCVVGLDMSEMMSSSNVVFAPLAGSTGVINTELKPNQSSSATWANGLTPCTSSEIINGDALRSKNFTVVNVVGG